MKNKCIPLYKPTANGSITFLGRRQSSTLITSLCSSCRHKENCRMTTIKSGPHTCNSFISTSNIRQGAPIIVDYLSRPPVATLTTMLHSCGHEALGGPNSMRVILTSLPLTRCWVQACPSLTFIFRMDCYAIWAIFVFLQASG
jgi:hypothetical protein